MSEKDQKRIIQEQNQANQRIIQAVERKTEGVVEGQAPVNERIKQFRPNERTQTRLPPKPPKSDKKSKQHNSPKPD